MLFKTDHPRLEVYKSNEHGVLFFNNICHLNERTLSDLKSNTKRAFFISDSDGSPLYPKAALWHKNTVSNFPKNRKGSFIYSTYEIYTRNRVENLINSVLFLPLSAVAIPEIPLIDKTRSRNHCSPSRKAFKKRQNPRSSYPPPYASIHTCVHKCLERKYLPNRSHCRDTTPRSPSGKIKDFQRTRRCDRSWKSGTKETDQC